MKIALFMLVVFLVHGGCAGLPLPPPPPFLPPPPGLPVPR